MNRPLFALALAGLVCAAPAKAQLSFGVGGGAGIGNKAGSGSAFHGMGYAEFKLPVLPGIRGDAMVMDSPAGSGPLSLALNVVLSLPIPFVKPYAIAGWGSYGLGKGESVSGWNAGVGIRLSLARLGVFGEVRRHDEIDRNLATIGITF